MFFVGYAFTTASQVASRRTIGCVVRKSTRATSVDRDIANVPVATYIPVHVHTYMTYIHTIVDMTHTYIHTDTYIHTKYVPTHPGEKGICRWTDCGLFGVHGRCWPNNPLVALELIGKPSEDRPLPGRYGCLRGQTLRPFFGRSFCCWWSLYVCTYVGTPGCVW